MKFKTHFHAGFTRTDLVAVIGIFFAVAMLTGASVGEGRASAQTASCLGNMQQMMRALHLYTSDYSDYLPPMNDVSSGPGFSNWLLHNASTLPDATNSAKLLENQYSLLSPYLRENATVFKCPSDTATVTVNGTPRPRVRSVSMSQAVGTLYQPGLPKSATDGRWLDGNATHIANTIYRTYARFADIVNPRPSGLWVFLDERPESINDANFGAMGPSRFGGSDFRWIDWPGKAHNNAGSFAFADGHGEIHSWLSSGTIATPPAMTGAASLQDVAWLAVRTSALVTAQP